MRAHDRSTSTGVPGKGEFKMNKPESVIIFGKKYKIEYVKNASEVDIFKRESLWGQVDFWTCTIRVFDSNRDTIDIFETIVHEMLHAISFDLKIKDSNNKLIYTNEDIISLLAMGLADTFTRNGWVKINVPESGE
jgi:hypothetical protein